MRGRPRLSPDSALGIDRNSTHIKHFCYQLEDRIQPYLAVRNKLKVIAHCSKFCFLLTFSEDAETTDHPIGPHSVSKVPQLSRWLGRSFWRLGFIRGSCPLIGTLECFGTFLNRSFLLASSSKEFSSARLGTLQARHHPGLRIA
jgi:hypothetical protein